MPRVETGSEGTAISGYSCESRQSYLRFHGPDHHRIYVSHRSSERNYESVTDVDVPAVRFPGDLYAIRFSSPAPPFLFSSRSLSFVLPVGPVRLFVLLAFVEAGDTVGEIDQLGSGNGPPRCGASAV